MVTTISALDLPFDEAIAFLRAKANVTSESYVDVWGKANAKAFTVAGASTQALVGDFRSEVAKALEKGTSLKDFRKTFDALVTKHGWDHTGTPGFRSRIIFETNLGMAYSAGRYAQQTEPETLAAFPYWQYVHSGALHPRLQHKAWDGTTLRADDPWWSAHYPPNGWRCGCRTRPVSARGLARMGKSGPDAAPPVKMVEHVIRKTGEVIQVPEGIDPGFDYNVGQEWTGRAPQIPANATLTAKSAPASPPPAAPAPASPPPAAPAAPAPAAPDDGLVQVLPAVPPAPGVPIPPPPADLKPPPSKQPIPGPLPKTASPTAISKPAASPKPPSPPIAVKGTGDLSAADKLLHEDFIAWGRGLARDEVRALEAYKGSAFRGMNEHLREVRDAPSYEPMIRALDTALARARTKRPLTVYRGVKTGTAWDTVQVGETIRDPGFSSTSINPVTAENFSGGVIIEMRLPAGYSGGAYVNRIPSLDHREFEFLVRPGMPFKVVERTGNRIVVEPVRGGRRIAPKLDR